MTKLKFSQMKPRVLVLLLIVLVPYAGLQAQRPTSVAASPNSATPVKAETENRDDVIGACAAAAAELSVSRKLIEAVERENRALTERIETYRRTETLLTELNTSRRSENEALRTAVSAKNETIAAKDAALARQAELITELKKRKTSLLKRIGDIMIGVAVSSVLK